MSMYNDKIDAHVIQKGLGVFYLYSVKMIFDFKQITSFPDEL